MTEVEWLDCIKPWSMQLFLRNRLSERKKRLLGVACCRMVWDLLADDRSREAVDAAEQQADGLISRERLLRSNQKARKALAAAWRRVPTSDRDIDLKETCEVQAVAARLAVHASQDVPLPFFPDHDYPRRSNSPPFMALFRDIAGNPFRPTTLSEQWKQWNDGCVVKIAQAIYADRRFEDMPILADALEESGCDNADILAHCRLPGEHVRGCWVVDLLLGKE